MRFPNHFVLIALSIILGHTNATAADTGDDSGLDAKVFALPNDLEIAVWAKSPQLYNPTNIDVDIHGRVWVAEGMNYRRFKHGGKLLHPKGDRIVVLTDSDGDGKADRSHVFVQDKDLVAPLGIAVLDNQVIVSNSPSLIIYTDVNRNAVFEEGVDEKEIFLTGFGGADHDHGLHALFAGPDGRWHFNVGNAGPHIVTDKSGWTLRSGSWYSGGGRGKIPNSPGLISDDGHVYTGGLGLSVNPDGTDLQVHSYNYRNCYEIILNSFGEMFQNDNDDQVLACRTTWLMQYANTGYASADGRRSWQADRRPGQSLVDAQWHQDDPGVLPYGDVYGAGSPTGIAVHEGDELGPRYRGMLFSCEAGRNVVYGYRIEKKDAGFRLNRSSLLTSGTQDDPNYKWREEFKDKRKWFRPSDVAIGTDGAIYVADWFDPIVGGHVMHDERGTGTIYRITPKNRTLVSPKIDVSTTAGQLAALRNPAINVRYIGFAKLKAQGEKCLPQVSALLSDPNPFVAARAIWLLANLGEKGKAKVIDLCRHEDDLTRVTAFRALRSVKHDCLDLAKELADDPSPQVKREVALAMRDRSFEEAKDILLTIAKGYDGWDRWYLEALGIGCTNKEKQMYPLLLGNMASQDAEQWDDRFARIVWRLHPENSVEALKQRALSDRLTARQRKRAIAGLAFIKTAAAAEAMVEIDRNGPDDHRAYVKYWLNFRRANDWRDFLPAVTKEKSAELIAALKLQETLLSKESSAQDKTDAAIAMTRTKEGGQLLMALARRKVLDPSLVSAVTEHIYDNPEVDIRVDARIYFPRSGASTKHNPSVEDVVALKGNAIKGMLTYFGDGLCFTCHKIDNRGGEIGPELEGIGSKFDAPAIADSLLNPSAGIVFGFDTVVVARKDGTQVTGFLIGAGDPLVIKDRYSGEIVAIPAREVRSKVEEEISMMPSAVAFTRSTQEIADLVAYLQASKSDQEEKKYRLSACDWSIGKKQTPEALVFAKELGLDGVQVSFNGGENDLRDKAVRERYREQVKATGVAISSLAMGILNSVPYSSDPRAEQWVSEVVDVMILMEEEAKLIEDKELADMVRPKVVLLAFFGRGDINGKPELIDEVIRRLKKVAPKAEKHGITLGLETWLSADDLLRIIKAVDSPAVKVYYDVANAEKMGYDIYEEVKQIGVKNICEIHCKENDSVLGKGRVDFVRFRKSLDDIGYDGWLVIEKATSRALGLKESYLHNRKYLEDVFNEN